MVLHQLKLRAMYFERQQGSNCRIHAINNCFGSQVLCEKEFQSIHRDYQKQQTEFTPESLDYVNASNWKRSSLLSTIIWKKFGLYSFTVGHFELPRFKKSGAVRSLLDVMDLDLNCFLVADTAHVTCVKYHEGVWYATETDSHNAGAV